jgi:hypothetical protein
VKETVPIPSFAMLQRKDPKGICCYTGYNTRARIHILQWLFEAVLVLACGCG